MGIHPGVELAGCGSGEQVKKRVQDAPPGVFQNDSRQPQKPHIENDVHPSSVQESGCDVGNRGRVRGYEAVAQEDRVGHHLRKLQSQRIHFFLRALRVHRAHLGVPIVEDLASGVLQLLPDTRLVLLDLLDELLHILRGSQFGVQRGQHENVQAHGAEFLALPVHLPVGAKENQDIEHDERDGHHRQAPAAHVLVPKRKKHSTLRPASRWMGIVGPADKTKRRPTRSAAPNDALSLGGNLVERRIRTTQD